MIKKAFFFLLTTWLFSLEGYSQVTVSGVIHDTLSREVVLYEPIDGFFNGDIADSAFKINLDPDGRFERNLDIRNPIQLLLTIGLQPCFFIVFPGDKINILIDGQKLPEDTAIARGAIIFSGANSAGNELLLDYNPFSKNIYDFDSDLKKARFFGHPERIELFDSILKNQTQNFDDLLLAKKISKPYHFFVTGMIRHALVGNFLNSIRIAKNYSYNEKMDVIGKFYDVYKLKADDPLLKNNFFRSQIASWQYSYLQALKDKVADWFPNRNITINGKSYFLNGNLAPLQNADKALQEGVWALQLIRFKQLFGGGYGQKDVDAYLAVFPNSPFKKYFKPPYFGFPPWSKTDSSKAIVISLQPRDNLDSIISKYFKGKKVLIDLWATWCIPCKQEFQYGSEVDKYCKENDIERLYISLDNMETRDAMIKDIYAYHLGGIHVMSTFALQQDIVKRVYDGKENNLTIPRYILINSKGEIVDSDFLRPSKEKLFYKRMLELLK